MKKTISVLLILSVIGFHSYAFAESDFELPDIDVASTNIGKTRILLYQYNSSDPVYIEMGNYENGGPGITDDGDLLVPLKIAVSLSYTYTEENDTIYLSNEYADIEIPLNEEYAVVDGEVIDFIHYDINNQVYFSYEYISQLFNITAEWDVEKNQLILYENENTPISDSERQKREQGYSADEKGNINIITVCSEGSSSEEQNIEVMIGGQRVDFDIDRPFIDTSDRVQVPIRYVAEMLNFTVDWDAAEEKAIITSDSGSTVIIPIGSRNIIAGENIIEMDTEAVIVNDRTYISIRFLAEAMNMSVEFIWD